MNNDLGINIKEIIIKIIMVVLFVFLLMWLFPMPNMNPFYDRLFADNIETMKNAAKSYYTVERLPKEIDDTVYMTLEEMEEKRLLLPLVDSENNFCDTKGSYVEIMKAETEYIIKTHLSCPARTDYLIEHLGCYDLCDVKLVAEKEEKPKIEKQANKVTKNPIAKVIQAVKPKPKAEPEPKPEPKVEPEPTKITNNPIVKVIQIVKTDPKPDPTPEPKPEPKPESKPEPKPDPVYETLVLYGKSAEVNYSNWTTTYKGETVSTRDGKTTRVELYNVRETEETNLKEKVRIIYSAMYIYPYVTYNRFLSYPSGRILDLDKIGISKAAQRLNDSELDLKVVSWDGLNAIADYVDYNKFKTAYLYSTGSTNYNSGGIDPYAMKSGSLKYGIDFMITSIRLERLSLTTCQVNTGAYLYNTYYDTTNSSPYYDSNLGQSILFVPHKFVLQWREPQITYTKEYKYKTTYSYVDQWVKKGSTAESDLKREGYYKKGSQVVKIK